MSAIFLKKNSPILFFAEDAVMYYKKFHIWCKFLFFKNLLFLRFVTSLRARAIRKKNNYHVVYYITHDVPAYYHMSVYNKGTS